MTNHNRSTLKGYPKCFGLCCRVKITSCEYTHWNTNLSWDYHIFKGFKLSMKVKWGYDIETYFNFSSSKKKRLTRRKLKSLTHTLKNYILVISILISYYHLRVTCLMILESFETSLTFSFILGLCFISNVRLNAYPFSKLNK